jgi:hypothetical protein
MNRTRDWRTTGADWRTSQLEVLPFCASAPVAPVPIGTAHYWRGARTRRFSTRPKTEPRYLTRGKPTETIHGDHSDIEALLPRTAPAKPRPSKQELRQEAEKAFKEFSAKPQPQPK